MNKDITDVDDTIKDFMNVLVKNNGEADTTTIRRETGLSSGQVNYRFRKLSKDLGWIDVRRAESGKGDRAPPKIAVLNDNGDEAIRKGDAGKEVYDNKSSDSIEVTLDEFKELNNEIDELKNRVDVISDELSSTESTGNQLSNEDEIRQEIGDLRSSIEMLDEIVKKVSREQSNIRDETVQELESQQEYLEEWMETAQVHLVAFRRVFNEEFDVELSEYMEDEAGSREEESEKKV